MASRAAATFRRFRAISDSRKSVAGPTYDWDARIALVDAATGRSVWFRRLRIISEPVSDYLRAGGGLRWLPRHLAFDLPHPVADFFMWDQRLTVFR